MGVAQERWAGIRYRRDGADGHERIHVRIEVEGPLPRDGMKLNAETEDQDLRQYALQVSRPGGIEAHREPEDPLKHCGRVTSRKLHICDLNPGRCAQDLLHPTPTGYARHAPPTRGRAWRAPWPRYFDQLDLKLRLKRHIAERSERPLNGFLAATAAHVGSSRRFLVTVGPQLRATPAARAVKGDLHSLGSRGSVRPT